jgi:A/G-specific adenine glycosylase
MDLGATICLPKSPKCLLCPVNELCAARAKGLERELPRAAPKKPKPLRRGVAFWLVDDQRRVLLRRRPPKGLLGGMMEVPSTDWRAEGWTAEDAAAQAPADVDWNALPGQVSHTFTHFHLELEVWRGVVSEGDQADGEWRDIAGIGEAGLPSVMMKVARHAMRRG